MLLAVTAAVVPLPAEAIERLYSRRLYPQLQAVVTTTSNLVPFSLFDVLLIGAICALALLAYRSIRRRGWARGIRSIVGGLVFYAAAAYLVFLCTWGLNYRRVPLVNKLAFDPARTTAPAVAALGTRAVRSLNALYARAHEAATPQPVLATAFYSALDALDSPRVVTSRPKATLLGAYFHNVAVAGMTDPWLLETLIAPDLLDVEKPFVVAHEWAHLAGYADESEANFISWLTCQRAGAAAQYSAWLVLLGSLDPPRDALKSLAPGPRIDIFAMTYRYSQTPRVLRFAAREGYDKYLKANRVDKGVASYDAVVQLIAGTQFDSEGDPVLQHRY